MAGLVLKLRPYEQLMINGVVIENGDRRAYLRVKTDGAKILRMKNALTPDEATTPLKRAYFIAQQAASGQLAAPDAVAALKRALAGCAAEMSDGARRDVERSLAEQDYYAAMRRFGDLIRTGGAA